MQAVYFFSVVAFKHMFVVDIHFWNVGSFTCFKVGDFFFFLISGDNFSFSLSVYLSIYLQSKQIYGVLLCRFIRCTM